MSVVHVYPTADLIEHDTEGDECVCLPTPTFVPGGVVIIHHSLDGRELTEGELASSE